MLPKLSFIIGGAASGKSSYAEGLLTAHQGPKTYLASAQAFDSEMENKISRHKVSRGGGWTTIEEPVDVGPIFEDANADSAILFDCATLWLSNLFLANRETSSEFEKLLDALAQCPAPVVVVSNEVGAGIVPADAMSRDFRETHGRLNQKIAAQADYAALVVAGLPLHLKGAAPQ
ncbi:bifunctional adenosylcobinamide kinase/adenosylcobinamide-phosphate guanylyltransferase [Falsihalocynthiibacter sp. SS001]|uniref:bifunctional adenosylcobinamide kinase/adenosylcobinamide-phosphate guanylyltransferase n=1 Tax=Falsihalocynthiibacter sp. SS001 TaxID=3349698 RepID=UPI0036D40F40